MKGGRDEAQSRVTSRIDGEISGLIWSYVGLGTTVGFSRGQMTAGANMAYTYSATANDGRLVSRRDVASGEEVTYLYDELGRLTEAATAGPAWGLRWTFDGFGNRLSQVVTKGTGPAVNLTVDAATNRIAMAGFVYDANGNLTQWMKGQETWTAVYDVENRVTQVEGEAYLYNAANQRVVTDNLYGSRPRDFVYGLGGELLGEYERCWTGGGWYVPCNKEERTYLGGRLIEVEGVAKVVDRMGMSTALGYPYLENTGGPEATWKRDAYSGLDYAWNRYYSSTWGRFTSADPYRATSRGANNPQSPQSWNRYSYVLNDPVNLYDPLGTNAWGPHYVCPAQDDEGLSRDCVFEEGDLDFGRWPGEPAGVEPGGGGGPPRVTNKGEALSALERQLNHLNANCKKILPEAQALLSNAKDLLFWDARVEGSVVVNFLPGASPSTPGATLQSELGTANAVVLSGPAGSISPHVVLGDGFFLKDATVQGFILLHELLHYTTQQGDKALVSPLYYNIPLRIGDSASSAFQAWLENDCNDPK